MELDMQKTTFLPGQTIQGHVSLDLAQEQSIQHLKVKFLGQVTTTVLLDKRNDTQQYSSVTLFRDSETWIEDTTHLHGQHIFPFSFRVPPTSLPATFNGNYGRVHYSLVCSLEQPLFPKINVTLPITIPSTKNASNPDWQQLNKIEKAASILKRNLFHVFLSTPKMAYAVEDVCPITLEITNNSSDDLLIEKLCVKQKVKYVVLAQQRAPRTEIIHKIPFSEHIPADIKHCTRLIQLPIPNHPILDPDISTSIIKVTHVIQVDVKSLGAFPRHVKLQLPLIIAGFPYMLFDEMLYRKSVDTLPVYTLDNVDAVSIDESVNSDVQRDMSRHLQALKLETDHSYDSFSECSPSDNGIIFRAPSVPLERQQSRLAISEIADSLVTSEYSGDVSDPVQSVQESGDASEHVQLVEQSQNKE
ncbi:immunoglobulin E-set [Gorgonomyces haynaldii]|nr:immunoglobulin E-set [Gorgonomyces haynaldii]